MWQGTAEPVVLTLDLTEPTGVSYTMQSRVAWTEIGNNGSTSCGRFDDENRRLECRELNTLPQESQPSGSGVIRDGSIPYGLRVFEDNDRALTPCPTCAVRGDGHSKLTVELPPRVGASPRRFVVMTTIKTVDQLRPGGASPYGEIWLGGPYVVSGKLERDEPRCFSGLRSGTGGQSRYVFCDDVRTYRLSRGIASAALTIGDVVVNLAAAPSSSAIPRQTAQRGKPFGTWNAGVETFPPSP